MKPSAFCVLILLPFALILSAERTQFLSPVTTPISHSFSGPYSVAVADLDRDGLQDIVIGQIGAPEIVVISAASDPRFHPPVRIKLDAAAGSVAIADFDGDGMPDIAAGCARSPGTFLLTLFHGNGDLTFNESRRIVLFSTPNDLLAVDLNGDGRIDLAVTDTRAVRLLFGNGDGTFQPPVQVALPASPILLRTSDFDGNGMPDLVVAFDRSSAIGILLAKGAGQFQSPVSLDLGMGFLSGITIADFNGDQHPDLAVCATQDAIVLLNGDGRGSFSVASTLVQQEKYTMTALASADLDKDGLPDLVAGHYYSGMVRIFRNQGGGKMSATTVGIKGDMFRLVLADLDGDSAPDLVVPSYSGNNVVIARGAGDGTFNFIRFLGAELDLSFTGDLDSDGTADSAVLDKIAGCIHILRRGTEPVTDLCVELSPYTAAMADFNSDGVLDIAISEGPMSWPTSDAPAFVRVFLGNGDFTFRVLDRFDYVPWGPEIVVADLNGDGIPDLATSGFENVVAYFGRGDGTFAPPRSVFPAGAEPLAAADLDGDGKPDLVIREYIGSTSLSILLNARGNAFARGPKLKEDNFGRHSVSLADLNGDGFLDIVASAPERLYIFLGSGTGTFRVAQTLTRLDPDPLALYYPHVVDVDADGIADIVAPNAKNNCAQVFFGNGDGSFMPPIEVVAGMWPVSLAAADFDGDGRRELVFSNSAAGTVTMLKMGPAN